MDKVTCDNCGKVIPEQNRLIVAYPASVYNGEICFTSDDDDERKYCLDCWRKIEFREKYKAMANEYGIAITNLEFYGLKDKAELVEKYREDHSLNNIPLSRFDNMTLSYNAYNRKKLSLSDGCCIYKVLLKEIAEEEMQKE